MNTGLSVGMCVPLAAAAILLLVLKWDQSAQKEAMIYATVPVFRGFLVLIVAVWLFAWVAKMSVRYRVNYPFILDLDPATTLHWKEIFTLGAYWCSAWLWTYCIFTLQVPRCGGGGLRVQGFEFGCGCICELWVSGQVQVLGVGEDFGSPTRRA